jgi:hypothetical protein
MSMYDENIVWQPSATLQLGWVRLGSVGTYDASCYMLKTNRDGGNPHY